MGGRYSSAKQLPYVHGLLRQPTFWVQVDYGMLCFNCRKQVAATGAIHIKVDSGMSRNGCQPCELPQLVEVISGLFQFHLVYSSSFWFIPFHSGLFQFSLVYYSFSTTQFDWHKNYIFQIICWPTSRCISIHLPIYSIHPSFHCVSIRLFIHFLSIDFWRRNEDVRKFQCLSSQV